MESHAAARLREPDLRWTLTAQDWVRYRPLDLAGTPAVFGLATDNGVQAGLPAGNLWLSLWADPPAGREGEFLRALRGFARAQGKGRVLIGGDEFHFVPGIPSARAADAALRAAAEAEGFTGSVSADFVGPLTTPGARAAIAKARARADLEAWTFPEAKDEAARDELDVFLAREFPGRWHREFRFWRSRADTGRGFWHALRDARGAVAGFARMAVRGRMSSDLAWTPGALRSSFGEAHAMSPRDACLGPIGVASALRGQGLGNLLLGLVLEQLHLNDAEHVCIDWTDAFKYYEPLKFSEVRRHWSARCSTEGA